eukprot:257749-Rhodomonas_salina.4
MPCGVRDGLRSSAVMPVSADSEEEASGGRYVHYIERVLTNGGYRTPTLVLKSIIINTCPSFDLDGGCDPWFTIEEVCS